MDDSCTPFADAACPQLDAHERSLEHHGHNHDSSHHAHDHSHSHNMRGVFLHVLAVCRFKLLPLQLMETSRIRLVALESSYRQS